MYNLGNCLFGNFLIDKAIQVPSTITSAQQGINISSNISNVPTVQLYAQKGGEHLCFENDFCALTFFH